MIYINDLAWHKKGRKPKQDWVVFAQYLEHAEYLLILLQL